jgi:hypothetical protein
MATATVARNQRARSVHAPAPRPAPKRAAPAAPRRKSGPVRRPASVRAPLARVAQSGASAVLDGLLRGPAWVVLIGVLLTGIVFLNVSLLELNRGIARTDAKAATLERTNSGLRERVASLDSADRIQQLAEARGFILPAPGQVTYLRPNRRVDARLAAAHLQPPATAAPQTTVPTSAPTPAAATLPTADPIAPAQTAAP